MYPNQSESSPGTDRGYIPYFYQSGLYLSCGLPRITTPAAPSEGYDFSSDVPAGRLFGTPQTVEQVIARGYLAAPSSEPETAMISDKGHTAKLGIDDLIGQIRKRYQVYRQNSYELERAKSDAVNSMYAVIAHRGSVAASSREAYSLTKTMRELTQQQLDERVRLWQDVSRLRLALPENAQSYLSAYRKMSLMQDQGGDGP